jgi:hypothetical protein
MTPHLHLARFDNWIFGSIVRESIDIDRTHSLRFPFLGSSARQRIMLANARWKSRAANRKRRCAMGMGPAEIVASLKELCAEKGPRLTTEEIVTWIEKAGGYESDAELIGFAKKMKARQYARLVEFEDVDSGLKIKRLWSFRDDHKGRRYYADILELPEDQRKRLIRQYARFLKQLRAVRKAMSDYFAGQQFFDFYPSTLDEEIPIEEVPKTLSSRNR